jgi:Bacterial PH domain
MSGDYDFDRAHGLPEDLPHDERFLWQGHPDWKNLALSAFHVRKVMIYFVALAVLQCVARAVDGAPVLTALQPFLWFVPMGVLAAGLLSAVAWLSAKTTTYTLTSKRVVMKIGMALPITFNIPFKQIDGAAITHTGGGAGDIYFRFGGKDRIAYLMLWPHARRWHFTRPEAAFRAIPNVNEVAQLAASSLNTAPTSANVVYTEPAMLAAE